jgi:microcystin degradation protein MlrC
MARLAFGGFQHETNSFAPSKADLAAFEAADGWPGLTRGAALFDAVAGVNIPVAGFIETAKAAGHELLPLSWSSASPSDQVTEEAYEHLSALLLADLAAAGPLDGLYLDLHGAMVAEHHGDGEGELLRRVRDLLGPDFPIVVSLDLHANISREMVELADRLVAFRTYPHVDMAETGARSARVLQQLLDGEAGAHKAFRKLPFLIPTTSGCTLADPAKAIYDGLRHLEGGPEITHLSFACGFSPADVPHCGPSVLAYGRDRGAVEAALDTLYEDVLGREMDFAIETLEVAEAVTLARQRAAGASWPVILADAQDNSGSGANSDTTWLLAELVAQGAEGAVVAVLCDPESAAAAHAAGEGAEITLALGAKSGLPGHRPFEGSYRVERLGDGNFLGTGPFYKGARMHLGPMACLSIGGVRVIVGSRKQQAADQAMLRHVGVEPRDAGILVLKSAVHFRADFQPIAEEIHVVAAPGPCALDNSAYPYRHLRPGLRIMPGGPAFGAD